MLARQIMQKDLITILPSSTLYDAAVKMKEYHVAMTIAADSKDSKTTCVGDVMTADPITINSDADFESALRVMSRAHIHRLPVTENGKLVGLLSSADLAAEMKEEFAQFIGLGVTYAKHTH